MRRLLPITACCLSLLLLGACDGQRPVPDPPARHSAIAESPAALYRAALREDALRVCTNTTRLLEVKRSFEAHYPGLVVEVTDLRGGDILRMVGESHRAGRPLWDLIVCTDESGIMRRELIPGGALVKYTPPDLADKLLPSCNGETLVFLREAQLLLYNTEAHEEAPVSNWWQLTEPRFRGRVTMENPLKSDTALSLLCMFCMRGEEMAASYQALYGKPLAIPHGSDGGREFIRRLVENGLVLVNSNAELAQAVGAPGQEDPPVGIMISSRTRNNDIGYHLGTAWELEPFAGAYAPNSVMMVGGAKSASAAKLFIRWLLGEADGAGQGALPYLLPGTWPVRTDVDSREAVDFDSLDLAFDNDYFYENHGDLERFWNRLLEEGNGG